MDSASLCRAKDLFLARIDPHAINAKVCFETMDLIDANFAIYTPPSEVFVDRNDNYSYIVPRLLYACTNLPEGSLLRQFVESAKKVNPPISKESGYDEGVLRCAVSTRVSYALYKAHGHPLFRY